MAQTHNDIDIDAALKAKQERLTARRQALHTEIDQIDYELGRIARYFSNDPTPGLSSAAPRQRQRQQLAPRGEVQTKVREAVYSAGPDGITTTALNKLLDGTSPQSIQNALTALKEKGE